MGAYKITSVNSVGISDKKKANFKKYLVNPLICFHT